MDILISFDTEDYATPEAVDATLWWTHELSARSIRGCFQLVGEVVRRLRRDGRDDVLAALAAHEIDFHTDYHSVHPTHSEAVEKLTLAEGVAWVLKTEAPCFKTLYETFGRVPVSYCKPGDSWSPATLLALAAAGLKVFCDAPFPLATGRPLWFAGMLCCRYDIAFDSFFGEDDSSEQRFKEQFEKRAAEIAREGVMCVYTHPAMLHTSRFWDEPFFKGRPLSAEQCPPAPLRSPAQITRLKDRCRRLLDWLKARPGARWVDYATVYAEHCRERRDLQALLDECRLKPGDEGRLPLREPDGTTYLGADVFRSLRYQWQVFPEGFAGQALLDQARLLAWTSAQARR
ncbi:MAG: hypothetical protein NTW87_16200 [Planctomycetota bacterium]|nr:hypothetical protein [Planctomycetota bacterium]